MKLKKWVTLALGMLLLTETASVQAVSLMQEETMEVEQEITEYEEYDQEEDWEEDWEEANYVELEQEYCDLEVEETWQLEVDTSAPANEITYSSSDETVATVSNTGFITAVNGGETGRASAKITVTWRSPSGEYTDSDSCMVYVNNKLELNKTSDVIYTKQKTKYKLTAAVKPQAQVTWKTSNKKIATVDANGIVTPKKAGNVTITATAGGVSKQCKIQVKESYLQLNETATAYVKHKVQLNASTEPSRKITWKSSNPKIAAVNAKGMVTGKKKGTVTITATANGITKKCKVKVEEPSISMYQQNLSIFAGSTYNMGVSVYPYTATIKWTSSNNKVVKVDKDGKITALKPGTAKITASINGSKASCQVKVVKDIYKLSNTSRTLTKGEKVELYVKQSSDIGNISYSLKEYNGVVSTSSEDGICTITANAKGKAEVLVKFSIYKNGVITYYCKPCTIKVVDCGISKQQFAVAKGKTQALELVNVGSKEEITSVSWSSTAPAIASVNAATGEVKGIKSGKAAIKSVVTYKNGEKKTYTAAVKVSDPKLSASEITAALQSNTSLTLKGINEYSNVQWKVSKKSVVTVSRDGMLKPLKKGTANIKAIVDGKELSCKVYISNPQLETSYLRCVVGKQIKIRVKGLNAKSKVTYKSSNHKVASVDTKGNIKVVGEGRSEILVNADGKEMYYVVEAASQRAIDACDRGYSIISTSTYDQEKRMTEGYYDCSALVFRAYEKDAGMLGGTPSWAPTAAGMAQHMASTGKVIAWKAVSLEQLRPGDLIFYGLEDNGRYLGIYHVSMYYGNDLRLEEPLDYYWERDNIVMVARPAP